MMGIVSNFRLNYCRGTTLPAATRVALACQQDFKKEQGRWSRSDANSLARLFSCQATPILREEPRPLSLKRRLAERLKHVRFIVSLLETRIERQFISRLHWYDHIVTASSGAKLYLGALPLMHHRDRLAKEGVKAVLCVTEFFENNYRGVFERPIPPEQWGRDGVRFLQLEMPDFQFGTLGQLVEAVRFIRSQLQQGWSIYIHCKAGIGRSAAVVVAYLLTYHLDLDQELRQALSRQGKTRLDDTELVTLADCLIQKAMTYIHSIRLDAAQFSKTNPKWLVLREYAVTLLKSAPLS